MSISMKSNSSDKTAVSVSDILNVLYPVGSIYLTYNNNNPSNFLGGTWEQFGQGRTLIGVGSGTDTNSTAIEFKEDTSGGEYYHTLTTNELPSHNHSISISGTTGANNRGHTHSYTHATSVQGHTLTIAEMPSHSHSVGDNNGYFLVNNGLVDTGAGSNYWRPQNRSKTTNNTGGGGSHSHGLNTSSATSGGESQNHTHTFSYTGNTGNNGSSNSHNNMQPYIVIYFWRRTN